MKCKVFHLEETEPADFWTWLRRMARGNDVFRWERDAHGETLLSLERPQIDESGGVATIRTSIVEQAPYDGRLMYYPPQVVGESYVSAMKVGRRLRVEIAVDTQAGRLDDYWRAMLFAPLAESWPETAGIEAVREADNDAADWLTRPLGIVAGEFGVQAKRIGRWKRIILEYGGLTQEQMAEREDISVQQIKGDYSLMRKRGLLP